MRRVSKIILLLMVVLAGLLVVNTVVLNDDTRPAEQTVAGGQPFELESGVGLQYTDEAATGTGTERQPIVLLHCYTCSGRWWEPLTPMLVEDHRVVTVDLIGHGGSEKPSSGYEITAQSAAVAELLNELGVRGATVVGHSMGGLVATSLAQQSSELVDRVVLIGTSSEAGQSELPFVAGLATTPVIGQAIWRVAPNSTVESAYGESFAPDFDVSTAFEDPDQVVDDLDDMTYTSFTQAREAGDDFIEEQSVASRLTETGVPVLAIDGAEDQILDVDEALAGYEAVPGARIERVDGSGHSPNVEDPEGTAELILPFSAAGGGLVVPEPPRTPPSPSEPRPNPQASKRGEEPGPRPDQKGPKTPPQGKRDANAKEPRGDGG